VGEEATVRELSKGSRRCIGQSQAASRASRAMAAGSRATVTKQLPDYQSSGTYITGKAPPLIGPDCVDL
jgi:hypothetical protein